MAETLLERAEAEEDSRETRKMDPELLAIQRIGRMLEELEAYPQARVLAYLLARHAPDLLRATFGKPTIPVAMPGA